MDDRGLTTDGFNAARLYDASAPLWTGVWRLIDRAPLWEGLRAHRLHLLAVHHLARISRPVPGDLLFEELQAIARTAATREVLAAARSAYDGRLLILKGSEVAARYPDPTLRPSADIDLLAEDPEAAQRALLSAGFEPGGPYADAYYEGLHHLRPLVLPGSGAPWVEIHRRPNWVNWSKPPSTEELLTAAVPAATQPGMLALPADFHVIVLVAHMWGEIPLRRVSDLVDLLAMTRQTERLAVAELAARFGLRRAWETSAAVAEGLLLGGAEPLPLRTWARDLRVPRDRTVLETHLRRLLGPWWSHPVGVAPLKSVKAVVEDLTPAPGETVSNKLYRVREALSHPNRPNQEHREGLAPRGARPRRRR